MLFRSSVSCFMRLNANGSRDVNFGVPHGFSGYYPSVNSILLQADEKILAAGYSITSYDDYFIGTIVRINGGETDGIAEIENANAWLAYPNPTAGSVVIEKARADDGDAKLFLYNALGELLSEKIFTGTKMSVDIDGRGGLYFIRLAGRHGSATLKVNKE